MPIYEYECGACAERHEFIQKFSDGPKRKCPSCGKSRLRKLVSAAAFHLKGDGWYVTDFRDKDKKKNGKDGKDDKPASAEAKPETKGEGSSGSTSESKSDAKSEPKPEKKAASSSKKGDSAATSAP